MANHLFRIGMLAKIFFYHHWAVRVMMLIAIPVFLIICASKKFMDLQNWDSFINVSGFVFVSALSVIYAALLMMFPARLVSLISSRQHGLLPYIRLYLAVLIVCALLLLLIIPYCGLVYMGANAIDILHTLLVLAVMFILSLIMMIPFVHLGVIKIIYIFTLPVLWGYLVPKLFFVPDFILGGMLVFIWSTFLVWWLNWQPGKKYNYQFIMNIDGIKQKIPGFFRCLYFRHNEHQDLLTGLLLGKFASGFYQVKLVLVAWIVAGTIFALFLKIADDRVSHGLLVCIRITLAVQLIQFGYSYSFEVFKNLNKIWLYFPFDRKKLLHVIEKNVWNIYLKNLSAIIFIVLVLSLCTPDKYLLMPHSAPYFLVALFASVLTMPISLSLAFIVYVKWKGSEKAFHLINGVSMLLLSGALLLGLELANEYGTDRYLIYMLPIELILVGVAVVLRGYSYFFWRKIEFIKIVV